MPAAQDYSGSRVSNSSSSTTDKAHGGATTSDPAHSVAVASSQAHSPGGLATAGRI